jgi:transposase
MLGGFDDSLAVKTNKNDAADAEAICEAVGRPNMRFVPIKSIEQQAILSIHRVRQGFVNARTAQANQIRRSATDSRPVTCHSARRTRDHRHPASVAFAVGREWPLSGTSKLHTQQARDWHITNPEPHR